MSSRNAVASTEQRVVPLLSGDEARYRRRYRALKELVNELSDESNLLALRVHDIQRRLYDEHVKEYGEAPPTVRLPADASWAPLVGNAEAYPPDTGKPLPPVDPFKSTTKKNGSGANGNGNGNGTMSAPSSPVKEEHDDDRDEHDDRESHRDDDDDRSERDDERPPVPRRRGGRGRAASSGGRASTGGRGGRRSATRDTHDDDGDDVQMRDNDDDDAERSDRDDDRRSSQRARDSSRSHDYNSSNNHHRGRARHSDEEDEVDEDDLELDERYDRARRELLSGRGGRSRSRSRGSRGGDDMVDDDDY